MRGDRVLGWGLPGAGGLIGFSVSKVFLILNEALRVLGGTLNLHRGVEGLGGVQAGMDLPVVTPHTPCPTPRAEQKMAEKWYQDTSEEWDPQGTFTFQNQGGRGVGGEGSPVTPQGWWGWFVPPIATPKTPPEPSCPTGAQLEDPVDLEAVDTSVPVSSPVLLPWWGHPGCP